MFVSYQGSNANNEKMNEGDQDKRRSEDDETNFDRRWDLDHSAQKEATLIRFHEFLGGSPEEKTKNQESRHRIKQVEGYGPSAAGMGRDNVNPDLELLILHEAKGEKNHRNKNQTCELEHTSYRTAGCPADQDIACDSEAY